jgi:hypothetical protein
MESFKLNDETKRLLGELKKMHNEGRVFRKSGDLQTSPELAQLLSELSTNFARDIKAHANISNKCTASGELYDGAVAFRMKVCDDCWCYVGYYDYVKKQCIYIGRYLKKECIQV